MRCRMVLLSDSGEVLHIDEQRLNPGFDLICELGIPIVRRAPEGGTHKVFGYKLTFMEYVELPDYLHMESKTA